MSTGIELNDDELIAASKIQYEVQEKYLGKDANMFTLNNMRSELEGRLNDIGLTCTVDFIEAPNGLTATQVTITGRTDKKLQEALKRETDFERLKYDVERHSSDDLRKLGANLDLME